MRHFRQRLETCHYLGESSPVDREVIRHSGDDFGGETEENPELSVAVVG